MFLINNKLIFQIRKIKCLNGILTISSVSSHLFGEFQIYFKVLRCVQSMWRFSKFPGVCPCSMVSYAFTASRHSDSKPGITPYQMFTTNRKCYFSCSTLLKVSQKQHAMTMDFKRSGRTEVFVETNCNFRCVHAGIQTIFCKVPAQKQVHVFYLFLKQRLMQQRR